MMHFKAKLPQWPGRAYFLFFPGYLFFTKYCPGDAISEAISLPAIVKQDKENPYSKGQQVWLVLRCV